jgi:hypothetical protein
MALAVHSDPSWRPTALVSLAAALFVVFLLLPWGNASFLEAVVTLYARTLVDQQAGAAPDVAATYDHLPDSGWAGFPRGRSPKGDRCRRRPGCLAKGSGEHHRQRRRLGRALLLW